MVNGLLITLAPIDVECETEAGGSGNDDPGFGPL